MRLMDGEIEQSDGSAQLYEEAWSLQLFQKNFQIRLLVVTLSKCTRPPRLTEARTLLHSHERVIGPAASIITPHGPILSRPGYRRNPGAGPVPQAA